MIVDYPFESLTDKIAVLTGEVQVLTQLVHQLLRNQIDGQTSTKGIELAMQITGLARGTVYNLVSKRQIPHYKKNKKIYFDERELLEWIKEGKRAPTIR